MTNTLPAGEIDTKLIRNLLLYASMLWLLWYISSSMVQDTSRRLANAPYVCLVLALAFTTILMLYIADSLGARRQVTTNNSNTTGVATLHYMNKHSLLVFLVANVMTGVVNMSTQTIHASSEVAFVILVVYTTVITCTAWGLEHAFNLYNKRFLNQTKQ